MLPKFIQQGVISWNRGSFELENYSSIVACATTSSTVRGLSLSFCAIDEVGFIDNFEEFWKGTQPTISSGKESKICLVSTPNGQNHFWNMWNDAVEGRSSFVPHRVTWEQVPGRDEKWRDQMIGAINSGEVSLSGIWCLIDPEILGVFYRIPFD